MKTLTNFFSILVILFITSCSSISYNTYAQKINDPAQITIKGDLDMGSLFKFIQDTAFLESNVKKGSKITIFLDSQGGLVQVSESMHKIVVELGKKYDVHTVVLNDCMSGCIPILQAGEKRIMKEKATLMLHKPRIMTRFIVTEDGLTQRSKDLLNFLKSKLKLQNQEFINLCVYKLSEEAQNYVKMKMKGDFYIKSKKALELGLIDKVIK